MALAFCIHLIAYPSVSLYFSLCFFADVEKAAAQHPNFMIHYAVFWILRMLHLAANIVHTLYD